MNSILTGSRALLGVLLLAAAATATAGTDATDTSVRVVSLEVEYTDLNLATTAGAKTLYKRISHAAHAVCGPNNSRSVAMMSAHRRCVRDAVNAAVEKVGAPTLTVLHQGSSVPQATG
jgi:UrcA family protein